jgi:putative membrane protein
MSAPAVQFEASLPARVAVATEGFGTEVGVAQQGWWDDDHDGWGWGGWLAMMGFIVVFWVVVAILVVWAVRSLGGGRPSRSQPEPPRSPLDIARERYARGEINDEEFERIKAGLQR